MLFGKLVSNLEYNLLDSDLIPTSFGMKYSNGPQNSENKTIYLLSWKGEISKQRDNKRNEKGNDGQI